jgi:hypothetical protein
MAGVAIAGAALAAAAAAKSPLQKPTTDAAELPVAEGGATDLAETDQAETHWAETPPGEIDAVQTNGTAAHGAEIQASEARAGEGIEPLRLHSQTHRFPLATNYLNALQGVAATQTLSQGIYKIFIKDGVFSDRADSEHSGEPWVLVFLAGGRVINQKTQVPVSATWSTLNGYGDRLVVEVIEPTILYAVFVDTEVEDNEGEMTVSIERLPS